MRVEAAEIVNTVSFPLPVKRKKNRKSALASPSMMESLAKSFLEREEEIKFEKYVHGLPEKINIEEFISEEISKCRMAYKRLDYMLAWKEVR
ncbi:MAG: hypothetical protein K5873_04385 [Treponema sp.]|nr:hypothetical protein [Treponema sp.]